MLKRLKFLESEQAAYNYILRLLARKAYGSWEIRSKLQQKSFLNPDQISRMISKLDTLGLINDSLYISSKLNSRLARQNKSPKLIYKELKIKGVPQNLLDPSFKKVNMIDAGKIILDKLTTKKIQALQHKKLPEYAFKSKLIQYLLSKGFNYDEICSHFTSSNDIKS